MNIAVITGASSGMGRAFAIALDEREAFDEIWLIARRKERLEELSRMLRAKTRILPLDLCCSESAETYRRLLDEVRPNISVLLNGSGFGLFLPFEQAPLSDYFRMIDLNTKAMVGMTYHSLPYMSKGSRILNIASFAGFEPVPYINVYAATKAFALQHTRALNGELRHRGIRAMAICPFWTKTEFFDRAVSDETVTYYSRFLTSEQVVERAFRDLKRGKDVSIAGRRNRLENLLIKLLPHTLVMRIWCKQQKKPY